MISDLPISEKTQEELQSSLAWVRRLKRLGTPADVLKLTRRIVALHAEAAKRWSEGRRSVALELVDIIWGRRVTYQYEPVEWSTQNIQKLMISALVAEYFVLWAKRGLLKHKAILIVGPAGTMKTTYSLLAAIGGLTLAGMELEVAKRVVAGLTFFESTPFVKTLNELVKRRAWVPVVILDDIGTQISKYWVHLKQYYWTHLFSVLDQLKDMCGVLIMTARTYYGPAARLREIADYVVDVDELDISGYVVDVLSFKKHIHSAQRQPRAPPRYLDVMLPTVRMPEEFWDYMMQIRATTSEKRLEHLGKALEAAERLVEEQLEKLAEKAAKLVESEKEGSEEGEEE